jgi:putative cardiolipin synthase
MTGFSQNLSLGRPIFELVVEREWHTETLRREVPMKSVVSRMLGIGLAMAIPLSTTIEAAATPLQNQAPFIVESSDTHQMQIINSGVAGLELRLQMIERAKKYINVEYFIYNTDRAGRIFTQALINKKRRNPEVQIRILVDGSQIILQLTNDYIAELAKLGIEVRYYNMQPLVKIVSAQYRDHRKLLDIDGEESITGSRNIADEYFDLNPQFNFTDRDIWVKGPIAKSMSQSFDAYWNDKNTTPVKLSEPAARPVLVDFAQSENANDLYEKALANYNTHQQELKQFFSLSREDQSVIAQIHQVGQSRLSEASSKGTCDRVSYVTDSPGFDPGLNKFGPKRHVGRFILEKIGAIPDGGQLIVESPYFIVRDEGAIKALTSLRPRNITATLLTNSLNSTDAFYVAGNFLPRSAFYAQVTNGTLYVYSGQRPQNADMIVDQSGHALASDATWGIHAKTFIFSDSSFAVGTFNVDPRSMNLNSEMLVACEGNSTLTKNITDSIDGRIQQSRLLKYGKMSDQRSQIEENASLLKRIEFILSIAPATIFDFLM